MGRVVLRRRRRMMRRRMRMTMSMVYVAVMMSMTVLVLLSTVVTTSMGPTVLSRHHSDIGLPLVDL